MYTRDPFRLLSYRRKDHQISRVPTPNGPMMNVVYMPRWAASLSSASYSLGRVQSEHFIHHLDYPDFQRII